MLNSFLNGIITTPEPFKTATATTWRGCILPTVDRRNSLLFHVLGALFKGPKMQPSYSGQAAEISSQRHLLGISSTSF
jgi:hypothetical protein